LVLTESVNPMFRSLRWVQCNIEFC
jgi:hypothetical protein